VPIIAATTSNFFIAGSPVVETYRRSRNAVIYSRQHGYSALLEVTFF
jgi:hypothetical protein